MVSVNKLEGSGETCLFRFLLVSASAFLSSGFRDSLSEVKSFLTRLRSPEVDKTLQNTF